MDKGVGCVAEKEDVVELIGFRMVRVRVDEGLARI